MSYRRTRISRCTTARVRSDQARVCEQRSNYRSLRKRRCHRRRRRRRYRSSRRISRVNIRDCGPCSGSRVQKPATLVQASGKPSFPYENEMNSGKLRYLTAGEIGTLWTLVRETTALVRNRRWLKGCAAMQLLVPLMPAISQERKNRSRVRQKERERERHPYARKG